MDKELKEKRAGREKKKRRLAGKKAKMKF